MSYINFVVDFSILGSFLFPFVHTVCEKTLTVSYCFAVLQPKPVLPLDKVELGFETPGNVLWAVLTIHIICCVIWL